jgi:E1-E2 ATPase
VDGPSCAPHPQNVATRYISPNTYGIWTCERLADEHARVRITASQGSTFLDRMIALVEGAERQKTPNEIALNILLAGLTIIFVIAVATIPSFASYADGSVSVVGILVALFIALIPTTEGAAVGDRHCRHGSSTAVSRRGYVQWLGTVSARHSSWSAESEHLGLLGPVQWQVGDTRKARCGELSRLLPVEDCAHNFRCQERQSRETGSGTIG